MVSSDISVSSQLTWMPSRTCDWYEILRFHLYVPSFTKWCKKSWLRPTKNHDTLWKITTAEVGSIHKITIYHHSPNTIFLLPEGSFPSKKTTLPSIFGGQKKVTLAGLRSKLSPSLAASPFSSWDPQKNGTHKGKTYDICLEWYVPYINTLYSCI